MTYEPPKVETAKLPTDDRLRLLEAKVEFLLDEVSGLRTLVRHLSAGKLQELPHIRQTRDSFDYQWRSLPEGQSMLSNPAWKATAPDEIVKYTTLPREWFAGKRVLDAGCGQGRWTYGFGKLDVGYCLSVDISPAARERTTAVAQEFGGRIEVQKADFLDDVPLPDGFDLVWCFGVLHHTGDTYRAFQKVIRAVKPGGYLFLMIYAEPRRNQADDYSYYHEMFDMRSRLRNVPFEEKVARLEQKYGRELLHGYFDAISPDINDLYRWDELVSWLVSNGFTDIQRTMDVPNHYFVARRQA